MGSGPAGRRAEEAELGCGWRGEWTVRALCTRVGSGHRPGSPSVTAQCDSRAFAGAQKCSGGSRAWRCFRCPELSGRVAGAAAACATHWRVVPAGPAAPTEGGGGQELPARCCQLLSARPLVVCLYSGDWRACVRSPCSPHSPPPGPPLAARWLRLPPLAPGQACALLLPNSRRSRQPCPPSVPPQPARGQPKC